MKNLDNHIQDILSSKLGNLETEVSPHVWSGIESQLAQQAAAAGTTAAAKTIATKWLWAAAIATSVTVATVAIVQLNKPEQPAANPTVEQTTPVAQSNSENAQQNAPNSDVVLTEVNQNSSQQTSINNNTRPLSTGPEHEIEYNTVLIPVSEPFEAPFKEPSLQHETEGQVEGTPSSSKPENPSGPLTNPSYNGSQETATANFSPVVVNLKDLRYFFIPEYTQGAEYEWNMGDGTVYDSSNPSHEFSEEGEFTVQLTVTDNSGKPYTYKQNVKAFKPVEVKIPTIFTPNGDGKNDVFEFEVISGQVEWKKIVILNNAGTVFESNGEEMWRGLDKQGNPCAEGTYTFLARGVDRNQAVIEKTGVVTLLRNQ